MGRRIEYELHKGHYPNGQRTLKNKACSTSWFTKEIQITTTKKSYQTITRMIKMKKPASTKYQVLAWK